jgi:uncharacterized protein YggE
MTRATITGGLAGVVLLAGVILLRWLNPVSAAGAGAQPKPEAERKVTTAGTGTVRVQPNAARAFLVVQTQAAKIKDARADNNKRVRQVMAALKALKIADLKTKTSDVGVEILYGKADDQKLPPVTGYRASTEFTVLIPNDDREKLSASAARVLDAALESGVNSVQQIAFLRTEGLAEFRRKALARAVEDALANARAVARAAGAGKERVEVADISGAPQWYGDFRNMTQFSNIDWPHRGTGEGALVVGDLEITCRVNATCKY